MMSHTYFFSYYPYVPGTILNDGKAQRTWHSWKPCNPFHALLAKLICFFTTSLVTTSYGRNIVKLSRGAKQCGARKNQTQRESFSKDAFL